WIGGEELKRGLDWMTQRWGKGKMFGEFLAPSWASDPTMRQHCARYERHAATPGTAEQIIRLNAQIDVTDILPSIRQPTLVLHRRDDSFIPLSAGKLLAERIPGAKLIVLEGADHLAFAGNTKTLLGHVEAFVTGQHPVLERDQRVVATVGFACMESAADRELVDRYHKEARRVGRSYQGRVIKAEGSTVLTTFAGPARAVRAAFDLQTAVEALGMELRVGLHTAEIELTNGEPAGLGVEIAAAVAKRARPGEVWASRTVRDLVAGSKLCFIERGEHQLGAVGEAWALYAVER
ncbi:MAG: adenylate/guanylate cyclase domain-containing protein, partial [Myxococcales bacterium]|nr:adenylate/guanylate cyclase domain-containing protein [Myxococcales bacterium]